MDNKKKTSLEEIDKRLESIEKELQEAVYVLGLLLDKANNSTEWIGDNEEEEIWEETNFDE